MNLPLYGQLPNCCGLSTFLMLINPEKNENFKRTLNMIYEYIEDLKRVKDPAFRWQVALNYILLQSLGENLIREYLQRKIPSIVKYYIPIALYELLGREIAPLNLKSRRVFLKSLFKMRTDADLKMLFALFGGEFIPQPQTIMDGTGGLYFTKSDFEENRSGYSEKIRILKTYLNEPQKSYNRCIALNKRIHWVAVNNMTDNDENLIINNPLSGKEYLNLSFTIPESFRFYFFKYSANKAFILKEKVLDFLKNQRE